LSFPGIYVKIKRPKAIQVTYQTSSGESRTEILEDLNAKCFLHEFDHLEGITFNNRLSSLKWALAVKKSKPKRKYK
jgi:peptide deformylase